MAHGFKHGGSGCGSGGLELTVVGGITRPVKPTQNMIWANTPNDITSVFMAGEKPSNPANGTLWLKLADSGKIKIPSPVGKDWITVYPLSAEQYVGGTWTSVPVISYQGCEWVEWLTYFYDEGNEFTNITGGWNVFNGQNGFSSKESNCLHLESATSGTAHMSVVATENAVSRGNYSKLNFAINFTRVGDHGIDFGVAKTKPTSVGAIYDGYTTINTIGEHTVTYDISGFDTFYVCMYAQGGIADVYKIWLS